uniref:Uncharacterized protein n=1 Tax=Romanomermis culicivorax TaxID=13658 RepID=A0A915KX63_ROMCU
IGKRESSEDLDVALVHLNDATKGLRRHLRRAVVDHVSDHFLDTQVPLLMLVDAARQGRIKDVESRGLIFMNHAENHVVAVLKGFLGGAGAVPPPANVGK